MFVHIAVQRRILSYLYETAFAEAKWRWKRVLMLTTFVHIKVQ